MKKSNRSFAKGCAVLLALFAGQNQMAFAGWSGLINGLGVGWASVNVRSSALKTNTVTTANNLASPSAAMAPTAGYKVNGALPQGASPKTFSRIKGLPGGIWQATAKAAVGDGTDNAELQSQITVIPADCASLTFDARIVQSQAQFNANGNAGTIVVNASATAGTALWLRGFEFGGLMEDLPADNPDTVENESIEYLKLHGVVKFDTLGVGPFVYGGPTGSAIPLIVPFTLSSGNLENLIFAADAVTLSLPLVVVCPSDIVVSCNEPFSYPPVQYAGCGEIAITYDPPVPAGGLFPAGTFPVGVTPVTVTATDSDGHSTNCTFTVTVTDTTPPAVPVLPVVTGSCGSSVTLTAPTTTDNCAGTITGTTTDSLVYSTAGTHKVCWTFTDGNGNSSVAIQTVIVSGLKFSGFYSPISGTGGSCASPVRICKRGDKITVKFDTKCGSSPYLLGKPTLSIEKSNSQCTSLSGCGGGDFKLDKKAWYFKWDTSDLSKATYKLTATLQDGSKQVVWIKLK